jgi:hypothetical protein
MSGCVTRCLSVAVVLILLDCEVYCDSVISIAADVCFMHTCFDIFLAELHLTVKTIMVICS